jgi:tRNA nucleotidyltransferase (CCA-adding enzyme)
VTTLPLELVPDTVKWLCRRLAERGKRGWIVGGCVRDLLLGRTVSDWDVATDALPEEVQLFFRDKHVIPTGIQHGTVTVMIDKRPHEVTTLRGEGAYTDGRRPDSVEFTDDITRDLARRDFTINAIALDPNDGHVIDPFHGREDLTARLLRAVGKPRERFDEDGLRVLRAARFVATLEVELESDTEKAIAPSLDTYKKVSQERVRDEWMKTMKARRPSRAFDVMKNTGILAITCPELLQGVGMEQNKWHEYDVWKHGMECMDACAGDPVLRIAALLHDVGKPKSRAFSDKTKDWTFYEHERIGAEMAEPILTRLRFSNDERARIVALVRHHLFHYSDEWSDATVRRWMRRVGVEHVEDLYAINEADVRSKGRDCAADLAALAALKAHVEKVKAQGAALSTRDLAINGNDLMTELGLKPSRMLGEVLNTLLEAVVEDPAVNERTELLTRARQIVAEKTPAKA